MKYLYFITYSLNIIILCLIFLDILKLDELNGLMMNEFSINEKILTIIFIFILYILLIVLNLPLTPFVTMYSAALLGALETIIYIFFASLIGVYLSLKVNRYFNNQLEFIKKKLKKSNLLFEPKIIYIVLLQIVPVIPFSWIIIYVSNTSFSSKKFLMAYSIGCIIPITLSAYLGKSIFEDNLELLSIILAIFIFLIIFGKLLNSYLKKN